MNPSISDLSKLSKERAAMIAKSEKGLLSKTNDLEKKLYSYVLNKLLPTLDTNKGKLIYSAKNLELVNSSKGLKKFMQEAVNLSLRDYYITQFAELGGQTDKYFANFEPSEQNIKRVAERGDLLVNGFVDSLFDNNSIVANIQSTLRGGVTTSQNVESLGQLLQAQIEGKENKFGAITSFHYGNGFDEMQNYSRALDNTYAGELNLNYAIYQGGEINTTRDFCLERNGNVYNRETILSWEDLTPWVGKIPNGNILIDAGGYNCRHDYDWISYALAKRLDPQIEKSTFDS